MLRSPLHALTLCCLPLLALACGRGGSSDGDLAQENDAFQRALETSALPEEAGGPVGQLVPVRELEITATADGNRVIYQLDNHAVPRLNVHPDSFGLVTRTNELLTVRDASAEVLVRFAPQVLQPGDSIVGEMIFLNQGDLVGSRLIYFNPQVEPEYWPADIGPFVDPTTPDGA